MVLNGPKGNGNLKADRSLNCPGSSHDPARSKPRLPRDRLRAAEKTGTWREQAKNVFPVGPKRLCIAAGRTGVRTQARSPLPLTAVH